MAAIKFGVSPSMQCLIDVTYVCWRRQILATIHNSPNIIARQNLLIYSTRLFRFFINYENCIVRLHRKDTKENVHSVYPSRIKLGFLSCGMRDAAIAACGMRQKRHISFLREHDSFYPFSTSLPRICYAVRQNESLHVAIHAANLYEFR